MSAMDATPLVTLSDKLVLDQQHVAYQACTKRVRELEVQATTLQQETAEKVRKLNDDARLEHLKIKTNGYIASSPYPDPETKIADKALFISQTAVALNEALVQLKKGEQAWVRQGTTVKFFRKVRLVDFTTQPGKIADGTFTYLDTTGQPIKTTFNSYTDSEPSYAVAVAKPPVYVKGDLVDIQGPNGATDKWYEGVIAVVSTLVNGEPCFDVHYNGGAIVATGVFASSPRIQSRGTKTAGKTIPQPQPPIVDSNIVLFPTTLGALTAQETLKVVQCYLTQRFGQPGLFLDDEEQFKRDYFDKEDEDGDLQMVQAVDDMQQAKQRFPVGGVFKLKSTGLPAVVSSHRRRPDTGTVEVVVQGPGFSGLVGVCVEAFDV